LSSESNVLIVVSLSESKEQSCCRWRWQPLDNQGS
jgi:hypothetical protein